MNAPHPSQDLDWAKLILERESKNSLYGTVTFQFKDGRPIVVKVEKTELAPPIDAKVAAK